MAAVAAVLWRAGAPASRRTTRAERTSVTSQEGTAGAASAARERATVAASTQFQPLAAKRAGQWARALRASSRAKAVVKKPLSAASARPMGEGGWAK